VTRHKDVHDYENAARNNEQLAVGLEGLSHIQEAAKTGTPCPSSHESFVECERVASLVASRRPDA